jgi:hypothetical protein
VGIVAAIDAVADWVLHSATRKGERHVRRFVEPILRTDEEIAAVVPSAWITLVGQVQAIVLTNQRLLVAPLYSASRRFQEYPREAVKVAEYKPGGLVSHLRLRLPGDKELLLKVRNVERQRADELVNALLEVGPIEHLA